MKTTRTCAVCGEEKPLKDFGEGIRIPKTTCLACHQKNKEPKRHLKKEKIDPVSQFLEELKKEGRMRVKCYTSTNVYIANIRLKKNRV
mgnify:CR=1 FL=1